MTILIVAIALCVGAFIGAIGMAVASINREDCRVREENIP